MVALSVSLALAGSALGAIGGALLFVEFFQIPSYIEYRRDVDYYDVSVAPDEVSEYSWAGRIGALLVAVAFALEFLSTLL